MNTDEPRLRAPGKEKGVEGSQKVILEKRPLSDSSLPGGF